VKRSQNGLDLVAGVFVHLKDHDAVKLSGNFEGVSNLNSFRIAVFRGRDGIALEEKTATLSQGAFRCAGEVSHAELGVRPDCNRGERAPIGVSEENHAAPHAPEHAALEGQPALAKSFGAGRLNELAPQISVKLGTGWLF
jgi:hypothetical protein